MGSGTAHRTAKLQSLPGLLEKTRVARLPLFCPTLSRGFCPTLSRASLISRKSVTPTRIPRTHPVPHRLTLGSSVVQGPTANLRLRTPGGGHPGGGVSGSRLPVLCQPRVRWFTHDSFTPSFTPSCTCESASMSRGERQRQREVPVPGCAPCPTPDLLLPLPCSDLSQLCLPPQMLSSPVTRPDHPLGQAVSFKLTCHESPALFFLPGNLGI